MKTHISNTYDLIVESESEDKGRTIVETLIYTLFILSAVISILQFVIQPVIVPGRIALQQPAAAIEQAG